MDIIKLKGEDRQLYNLIAHLVMKEEVLSYNLNYPYKTSPEYRWFVATNEGNILGFIPVKLKEGKAIINNYFIANDESTVLSTLLKEVIQDLWSDFEVESVTQIRHIPLFEQNGFVTIFQWKRYVKMKVVSNEKKRL